MSLPQLALADLRGWIERCKETDRSLLHMDARAAIGILRTTSGWILSTFPPMSVILDL